MKVSKGSLFFYGIFDRLVNSSFSLLLSIALSISVLLFPYGIF